MGKIRFCIKLICESFYKNINKSSNQGVNNWTNGLRDIKAHETTETHINSVERFYNFNKNNIGEIHDQNLFLASQLKFKRINRKCLVLNRLIELILLFAWQNIAFRGSEI